MSEIDYKLVAREALQRKVSFPKILQSVCVNQLVKRKLGTVASAVLVVRGKFPVASVLEEIPEKEFLRTDWPALLRERGIQVGDLTPEEQLEIEILRRTADFRGEDKDMELSAPNFADVRNTFRGLASQRDGSDSAKQEAVRKCLRAIIEEGVRSALTRMNLLGRERKSFVSSSPRKTFLEEQNMHDDLDLHAQVPRFRATLADCLGAGDLVEPAERLGPEYWKTVIVFKEK